MKPHCFKCGETDPAPMRDDDGDLIYWFRIEDGEEGETRLCMPSDEDDDIEDDGKESVVSFTGITEKTFDYDGSYNVVCPLCASEECEFLNGVIVEEGLDEEGWMEDGYDPFVEEEGDGSAENDVF